jgi:hypothetical protein
MFIHFIFIDERSITNQEHFGNQNLLLIKILPGKENCCLAVTDTEI